MADYLLKALLGEYLRQLGEALDEAQVHLQGQGGVEPTRRRVWTDGLHFSPPTEESPADQWRWVEEYPRHPALGKVDGVVERLKEFVDGLPMSGKKEE